MTIQVTKINQKPRTQIESSIVSEWVWWNMHNEGAAEAKFYERSSKAGYDDVDITGTTTNIWTSNPGYVTPDPTAGNHAVIPDSVAKSVYSLDNLSAGGVFSVCTINIGANPATDFDIIWYYGAVAAQYSLVLQFGANVNMKAHFREVGGTLTQMPSHAVTSEIGNDMQIGLYVDVSNSLMSMYVNEATASQTLAFPGDGTALVGASTPSNLGLGLLSSSADANRLGQAGTGSGTIVRDLFAIRFETDQSALIPSIMQGFIDTGGIELPWELEGK